MEKQPARLAELAAEQGEPFVGIALRPAEAAESLRRLDDAVAEIAAWTDGARKRRQGGRGQ